MSRAHRVWFVSEVYYPDEQGTAFYTTGLAEGLAADFAVGVLCSNPTVTARGTRVEPEEVRNGVRIVRCGGTTFNKDVLFRRIVNMVTFSAALFASGLKRVRRGDTVVAVTSPPSVPFIAQCICKLRGARCILRLEDVYPEAMVATGLLRKGGAAERLLSLLNRLLYRSVDRITVLGRDMLTLAVRKAGRKADISLIRSWADIDLVVPRPRAENALLRELGLADKFVVSCVGNMGRAQAVELMLEAATLLQGLSGVHFLFIGSGAKKGWLEQQIASRRLTNITILGQQPRDGQRTFLNACDLSIISLIPGMTGAGVPSRTYNIMAAGKPIIALTEPESEVALLVQEEQLGWVVPPRDPRLLVEAILEACAHPESLTAMGVRARAIACSRFHRERIIDEFRRLIVSMLHATGPSPVATGRPGHLAEAGTFR